MIEQLSSEIEAAKISLQEWQRKEREAADQVLLGRGYLLALARALEIAQQSQARKEPPSFHTGGSESSFT